MKKNINCCKHFDGIRDHLRWFYYKNDKGEEVKTLPFLVDYQTGQKIKVNHCPSCGKDISGIEVIENPK